MSGRPPGFQTGTPTFPTAPVGPVVRQKTAEIEANQNLTGEYDALARTIRIANRAERGPRAGRPFIGAYDGRLYPDGADEHDESTWLQPGESMDVDKSVAIHLLGNLWDATYPDRDDVIKRYGDYEYEDEPLVTGRVARMRVVGPPALPDLVAQEMSGRGKPVGEPRSILDAYKIALPQPPPKNARTKDSSA